MPDFESAILKTYVPVADASITLSDESSLVKTLVRSDREQFGVAFGASRDHGEALVCGTRPDEWLILGSAAAVEVASVAIDAGGFTSVIPFTHGRSVFRITGDRSPSMLEKVCGIDWSDNMTPNRSVVTASVALTTCDIIRNDVDAVQSYLLVCDRSFGQYLFDSLIDAGNEFAINVIS